MWARRDGGWRWTPLILKDRGNSLLGSSFAQAELAGDLVIEPPLTPPGPQLPPPPAPPPAQPIIAAEPVADPGAFHRLIASVQAQQRRQEWLTGALYGGAALALSLASAGFLSHASASLVRALLH